MEKLDRRNMSVEHCKDLVILLTYLTSTNFCLCFTDAVAVETYVKKIIKIYERNLEK